MGYRSQVAYVIVFDKKEVYDQFRVQYKLDEKFKLCWEDEKAEFPKSVQLEWLDEYHIVKFVAQDVKWYDDYPDVICHHDLMKLADEYDEKYGGVEWKFVRVGEEEGDIETEVGGKADIVHSYLYPVTSIQCDI